MRLRVELRVNSGKRPLMEMRRILASGWQHYLEQASSSPVSGKESAALPAVDRSLYGGRSQYIGRLP